MPTDRFPLRIRKSLGRVLFACGLAFLMACGVSSRAGDDKTQDTGKDPHQRENARNAENSGAASNGSTSTTPFSYQPYAQMLEAYVNDSGMVNYSSLKDNRAYLDAFARSLGELDRPSHEAMSDNEKIAFWINAYNALTLKVIIDHHPIKSSLLASLAYPRNSIRQISGVWDEIAFPVLGENVTLDHIEHQILRKRFNEPRIHMALVCAAMGCPPLRNEPYTGGQLNQQLDNQTRGFLANPEKFRIDHKEDEVLISPIFKWFGEDFVSKYGAETTFYNLNAAQSAVMNFIAGHLPEEDAAYLRAGEYDVEYLDYDWTLNEQ